MFYLVSCPDMSNQYPGSLECSLKGIRAYFLLIQRPMLTRKMAQTLFLNIYVNGCFKQGLVAKMEMIVIARYPLW